MAKFRAGKNSRVQVNGTNMTSTRWSTTLRADDLDTTNFENVSINLQGAQAVAESGLIGVQGLDWEIGTLWDAGQNPMSDPPGLYMRDDGANMKLFTNVADNKYWYLPTWRCFNSRSETTARGLVMFSASGKAQADVSTNFITGSV